MPKVFLAKTEPDSFSIDDFAREGITLWHGVHNHQAIQVIQQWQVGDYVLIYHSGKERKIVGLAQVLEAPFQNTLDSRYS